MFKLKKKFNPNAFQSLLKLNPFDLSLFFFFFFVQRLRSKHWTYMSKFWFFFHSVSNFLGFVLVKALPIGTRCPTVQLYTRQEREWERE